MKGWVYIISNQAMPGLVKVGHTLKDPELRAAELFHTGTPYSYVVEYEVLIEEPSKMERRAHQFLANKREGKEWFRCSAEEAVAASWQVNFNQNVSGSTAYQVGLFCSLRLAWFSQRVAVFYFSPYQAERLSGLLLRITWTSIERSHRNIKLC
jgi:hypothetical protein